jgi:hypothetical protein
VRWIALDSGLDRRGDVDQTTGHRASHSVSVSR